MKLERLVAIACLTTACSSSTTPAGDGGTHDQDGMTAMDAGPPGARLFVTSSGDATVRVFTLDDALDEVAKIPVCAAPAEVRATRDGKLVWTVCGPKDADAAQSPSQVAFIDVEKLAVVRTVDAGVKATHSYLAPDGRAWVCNDGSGDLTIIDPATFAAKNVLVGKGHHKAAFATDGAKGPLRFAYVSNLTDATISVLDPTGALVTSIPVANVPHGIDYSFLSKRVYNCSGAADNSVEVIATDGADAHTVVARVPLAGARCSHLEVSPDGRYAWASQGAIGKLARIDVMTHAVDTFDGGPGPDWFAFLDGAVFAADTRAWSVAYLNTANGTTTLYETASNTGNDGGAVTGHRAIAAYGSWVFAPNEELGSYAVINAEHGHVHAVLGGMSRPKCATVAGGGQALPYPR